MFVAVLIAKHRSAAWVVLLVALFVPVVRTRSVSPNGRLNNVEFYKLCLDAITVCPVLLNIGSGSPNRSFTLDQRRSLSSYFARDDWICRRVLVPYR